MRVQALGAGQEVGRSCILLSYKSRTVMLDCGLHPGREGSDSLPFFDSVDDLGAIDLLLVTHFHIDHCAALPYFTERTAFNGRIFMTHATKAVMKLLLADNIRQNVSKSTRPLYTNKELSSCIDKIETIDYHQTIDVKGIKFTASNAGHVLGAAMFTIVIDEKRVLYTGDYSMKADRHLPAGEVPAGSPPPDVMIVESTFGTTNLPDREELENKFVSTVEGIVRRGGSCLIPVFALGRAQELLLILDEYWQMNPDLQNIPVFYASQLAAKALRVYQTFVNMMNSHIKNMADIGNPFKLSYIKNMMRSDFDTVGSCVVMASPGFLQNGTSRQLFERWCDDERNGVIIAGYTVEGTLAHQLRDQPTEITCTDNVIKRRRCQIETISFSAHVNFNENMSFIKSVKPENIILVHGEKSGMKKLKIEIDREVNKESWPTTHKPPVAMPENGVVTRIKFPKSIQADCVGSIGSYIFDTLQENREANEVEITGTDEETMDGAKEASLAHSLPSSTVLVSENFVSKIMSVDEVSKFSSCRRGSVHQRLLIPLAIRDFLGDMIDDESLSQRDLERNVLNAVFSYFEDVFDFVQIEDCPESEDETHFHYLNVENFLQVFVENLTAMTSNISDSAVIAVEWNASAAADMVADCVVGVITQVFSAPNLLRRTTFGSNSASNTSLLGTGTRRNRPHSHGTEDEGASDEIDQANAPIIKKMKLGEVDPSKAVPDDAIPFEFKSKKAKLDTNAKRLQAVKELLVKDKVLKKAVDKIEVSADKLKLIFRGNVEHDNEDAYAYMLFGESEGTQHHASVQSNNDALKTTIVQALQGLTG